MKNIITLLAIGLISVGVYAQTVEESEHGSFELTLGGYGESVDGENSVGFDIGLSTNPFAKRPEVWIGITQGLYWEPSIAGSTDLFVDWSQNLWKEKLYLNLGWTVGAVYSDVTGEDSEYISDVAWRTGPEAYFQYYVGDSAFIYAGVNYDVWESDGFEGNWRYGWGIGLTW